MERVKGCEMDEVDELAKSVLAACEMLGLEKEASMIREYMNILQELREVNIEKLIKRLKLEVSAKKEYIDVWLDTPGGPVFVEEIYLKGLLYQIHARIMQKLLRDLQLIIKRVSEKMSTKPQP